MRTEAQQQTIVEQLKNNEDQLQLLIDSVADYAIFSLDPSGHVTSWSRAAQRMKGYPAEEILGKHFSIFYTREDIERGKPHRVLQAAATYGRVEDTGWRLRRDGTLFWANVVMTALHDPNGDLIGFGKVTRNLSQRKWAEEESF